MLVKCTRCMVVVNEDVYKNVQFWFVDIQNVVKWPCRKTECVMVFTKKNTKMYFVQQTKMYVTSYILNEYVFISHIDQNIFRC